MVIAVLLLSAFAMPGQAGSYTPRGRQQLSGNLIVSAEDLNSQLEAASQAAASKAGAAAGKAVKMLDLNSQLEAASQAAASEAGAAAGKAVKELVESFMDGKPAPTMSPTAAPAAAVQSATNSSETTCVREVRSNLCLP